MHISLNSRRFGARLGSTLSIFAFLISILGVVTLLSGLMTILFYVALVLFAMLTAFLIFFNQQFKDLFYGNAVKEIFAYVLPYVPYITGVGIGLGVLGLLLLGLDKTMAKTRKFKGLAIFSLIVNIIVTIVAIIVTTTSVGGR